MIFKKKFKYIEYIVLLVLLTLLSVLYLNHHWKILYNSDTLFLTQLLGHLTHEGRYVDWLIPTTPMYFPDWFVFSIAYVTKSLSQSLLKQCLQSIGVSTICKSFVKAS